MTIKTITLKPQLAIRILALATAVGATLLTLMIVDALAVYCASGPVAASAAQWAA